uniref:FIST domain-containing protein n=1 Tax=Ditylum brightwellii TaxID=49249 RepID=A0A6U3ULJ1_9STRA|mmetsp:Transcript_17029/g.24719  ORF Transcript_17029/g.24719 Transcript_17029/m.24719 type:complete len:432 (-) Transcript_17029:71-1366(-)
MVTLNGLVFFFVAFSSASAFAPISSRAFVRSDAHGLRMSEGAAEPVMSAGYGSSTLESTKGAVAEAVKIASSSLSNAPSIAFVSCTVSRDVDEVRKEFVDALPENVPIHGITSSGALLSNKGALGGAVGCLLLDKEGAFETAYDSENGENAVLSLKEKMASPQVIFMGATPGAEEGIIASINEHFPGVPVYGGTAADDALSGDWKVMSSESVSGTGVSLVAVGPSVKFGASMLGPYTETEKTAKATKTEGRRVFEIDGKPAADFVYAWLGEEVGESYRAGGLILPQTAQKPVGIKKPSGEYVTNHLAALGGDEKFVDFFAPIPEGAELIIMDSGDGPSTGYASALASAYDTAKSQGSLAGGSPAAGILVFCGGMAIAVGDNLDAGLTSDSFASKVGDLPVLGMTCFGEQAFLEGQKENVQRNLSVGMILLG